MTCIVGYRGDDELWMGTDSIAATQHVKYAIRSHSKLIEVDTGHHTLTFGYTSSFRFAQIIQHHIDVPGDEGDDPYEYLISAFVPAVRKALGEAGWLKKRDEREEGGEGLIGYRGGLFALQNEMSVMEPDLPYLAVGSGEELALGALHCAEALNATPQEAVKLALRAAADLNPFVMGPFDIRRVL